MAEPTEAPKDRMTRMLQKLLIMTRAFGLTRDDRLEIANQVVWRPDNMPPITSYSQLSEQELERMLDAMTGAVLVAHIVRQRQARQRNRPVHSPPSSNPTNETELR